MAIPYEADGVRAASVRFQFVQRLDQILEKLDLVARRGHMRRDQREDFISWALLRMVESNYSLIREWRCEARFRNYLNVVVSRLLLDFRNHRWGRFRVSKVARRHGKAAELLDTLIHRDGFSIDEAVELVWRNHDTGIDRQHLRSLAGKLPAHRNRRVYGLEDESVPSVPPSAAEDLHRRERQILCKNLQLVLDRALGDLPCDDLRILVMRFCRGFTADEIGADLDLDRRRVYQRIETILNRLRRRLCGEGFQAAELLELVGADDVEMRFRHLVAA
ncbi:MAG: sigma-70 family RNA polymerase sigma factor [Thermoanaerobaculia bacterium]|nr:sigma-70 family RNA polymerase sigma factor [Thermoanaerobaculia bacterium]